MKVTCNIDSPLVWRIQLSPLEDGRLVVSGDGLNSIMEILGQAQQSEDCRVLVLEGQPGVFCEGMDLSKVTQGTGEMAEGVHRFAATLLALRQAPQIVIGLLDGVVRAGGVGLAAAADILLATEATTFGLPEINLGLLPAMVMPFLQERMSPQKVRRWIMLGLSIDATTALQWGMIDDIVGDASQLEKRLKRELRQLLRAHPRAINDLKRLSLAMDATSLEDGLALGAGYTADCVSQEKIVMGIRSFLEGEPLPWFARYRPSGSKKK